MAPRWLCLLSSRSALGEIGLRSENQGRHKLGTQHGYSPASTVANCAALLECEQLLGSEALVVDLAGSLDQVLQVSASEEVTEVDELAVGLILTVDDTPPVLSTTDSTSVDVDGLLTADNGEGDQRL